MPEVLRDQVRVWYDPKRDCYSSNAAFILAKQTNKDSMTCAYILKAWVETNHPELFKCYERR